VLAALMTAFLVVTGGPWWMGIALGMWMASPSSGLLVIVSGLAVLAVRSFRRAPQIRLLGCVDIIAAELRAGQSLRHAVATGARESGVPGWEQVEARSLAGLPIEDVGLAFGDSGVDASRLRAVFAIAASTGGEASVVFDALSASMRQRAMLDRERRMATAQARFSAGVIAGGPLLVLVVLFLTGALGRLLSGGGAGAAVVVVGTALEVVGVGVVVAMIMAEQSS
jgi:Flp pilus assembly protein TadB